MNRPLTLESLRLLASHRSAPCVSLYMPTHRHHRGGQEDRIRYKNLVGRVEQLLAPALPPAAVREQVERLQALSTDAFWTRQLDGLAVFSDGNGRGDLRDYRLVGEVPELVVVADSFHLRPLLRHLQASGRYFLLRLSQNQAQLCAGDEHGLEPVEVPGLPTSLEDALGQLELESHLNMRSNPGGKREAFYHGHGTGKAPPPEDLLRYFRVVDAALWDELREQKEPLVVAAPKSYHTPYRSVCRYPHVLEEGLVGNHERSSTGELHELAWPLVRQRMDARLDGVLATYERWVSARRAIDGLAEVARSAVQGRVLDLLVAEGARQWGHLDPASGAVTLSEGQSDHRDDDVLDDLAEAVLLRGGDVFAVPPERMPSGSPVAALLRW
jgi:hypothetical protein